jgi:uncharacterized protein
MRLLILIFAIVLLAYVLRALFHQPAPVKRGRPQSKPGEKVVPCAVCDLHLPTSEAFREGDHFFCSREHRRQWLNSNVQANNRQ